MKSPEKIVQHITQWLSQYLLNAKMEGFVVGVTTWGLDLEQYNGAMSLDTFCVKILKCEFEFEGKKTWWDYSD